MVIALIVILFWPAIVFYRAWAKNNFSLDYLSQQLNYDTDLDGFGGLPLAHNYDSSGSADLEADCSAGYFIGDEDLGASSGQELCNQTCGESEYKFVSAAGIYINSKEIRGAWCLPSSVARCNLNTSNAFVGLNRYQCVSKFPQLFGGQYGNEIIGCGPSFAFSDMLAERTYSNFIPTNLVVSDLDQRLPDGSPRYVCKYNKTKHVDLANTGLGNRFDLETNVCAIFDSAGELDKEKLVCQCPNNNFFKNDPQMPCSRCTTGFGIVDEDKRQKGSRYGYSLGIDCVHPVTAGYTESAMAKVPCGVSTLTRFIKDKTTGCMRALVLATNTYSPPMLEKLLG